jgi:hypothetical protein
MKLPCRATRPGGASQHDSAAQQLRMIAQGMHAWAAQRQDALYLYMSGAGRCWPAPPALTCKPQLSRVGELARKARALSTQSARCQLLRTRAAAHRVPGSACAPPAAAPAPARAPGDLAPSGAGRQRGAPKSKSSTESVSRKTRYTLAPT